VGTIPGVGETGSETQPVILISNNPVIKIEKILLVFDPTIGGL